MSKHLKVLSLIVLGSLVSGCVAVVAGGAVAGGAAALAHDRRTAGTIVDDNNIEIKVTSYINESSVIAKNSRIQAVSYNNAVLLVGQNSTSQMKQEAESLAQDVQGVRRVYNEIEIRNPLSVQTRTNDSWITTKIKSSMVVNEAVSSSHIKVVTENGVVYLMGIVNADEENEAVAIARETKGVRKVVKIFEPAR